MGGPMGGIAEGEYTATIYGWIKEQEYDKAIAVLQMQVQNFPRSRAALSLLAYCQYYSQDFASAALTYESLLGADRNYAIGAALKFLNPAWTDKSWPIQTPKDELLEMHPSGCTERIVDYPAVRRAIAGTSTAKACDALAQPPWR